MSLNDTKHLPPKERRIRRDYQDNQGLQVEKRFIEKEIKDLEAYKRLQEIARGGQDNG